MGFCGEPECEKKTVAKGLCRRHYYRKKAEVNYRHFECPRCGRPVSTGYTQQRYCSKDCQRACYKPAPTEPCTVEGCKKARQARGLCAMHYTRVWNGGEIGPAEPMKAARGTGYVAKTGYRFFVNGQTRSAEHRLVFEEILGRKLRRFEAIHHKNGRRADNRPENLELWTRPQPPGQRVEDLVEWVIEFYLPEIELALAKQQTHKSQASSPKKSKEKK